MKKSLILDVNKEIILLNWIKNYQWTGKDIKKSFCDTLEHYNNMDYITTDIDRLQIKNFLIDYVRSFKNDNIFNSFLKKLYNECLTNNFKNFLIENEINFNNKYELQNFIVNNIYNAII